MSHQWLWDQQEHVDPNKEATAAQVRLGTLTTSLALEWQKNGIEWEEGLEQIARERALMKKLGIPLPMQPGQGTPPANDGSEPLDDSEAEEPEDPDDNQEPTEARGRGQTILAQGATRPRPTPPRNKNRPEQPPQLRPRRVRPRDGCSMKFEPTTSIARRPP